MSTYRKKFTRDNVDAPFFKLSVVIVPLPVKTVKEEIYKY